MDGDFLPMKVLATKKRGCIREGAAPWFIKQSKHSLLHCSHECNEVVEEHLDRYGQEHYTEELACYIHTTLAQDALQEIDILEHQEYHQDVEQQTDEDVDKAVE